MVALINTNVVIDFLATREPFCEASSSVIAKCANGEMAGYIALHSISNLWYILRKTPEDKRRKWLSDICECLWVAGASHEEVVKAIRMEEFMDFEDCLQDRCAEGVGADFIITRNVKDFGNSAVPAVSPEQFLEIVSGKFTSDIPAAKNAPAK